MFTCQRCLLVRDIVVACPQSRLESRNPSVWGRNNASPVDRLCREGVSRGCVSIECVERVYQKCVSEKMLRSVMGYKICQK